MQLSAWFKVNLSWGHALFRCDSWSHGGSQLFAEIECYALFLPQIIMSVEDTKFSGIEESLKIWVGAVIGLKPPETSIPTMLPISKWLWPLTFWPRKKRGHLQTLSLAFTPGFAAKKAFQCFLNTACHETEMKTQKWRGWDSQVSLA